MTKNLWSDDARVEYLYDVLAGIDVETVDGVVRVRDGVDTWLCLESGWDAMVERVRDGEIIRGMPSDEQAHAEIYSAVCAAVRGAVLSVAGSNRGTPEEQRQLAIAAALAWGIDPGLYGFHDIIA